MPLVSRRGVAAVAATIQRSPAKLKTICVRLTVGCRSSNGRSLCANDKTCTMKRHATKARLLRMSDLRAGVDATP